MLERLNNSINLLAFLMILLGALIGLKAPDISKELIVGGLGVFGGHELTAKHPNP
jgi:hypothetical protein